MHLKMTSERSKRLDFLSLIFISKSISKKLLIKNSLDNKYMIYRSKEKKTNIRRKIKMEH